MKLHIIYSGPEMLLSKEDFGSWREIQDRYADYNASLGPWEIASVTEYLDSEYSDLAPSASDQVQAFLESSEHARALSFA